MDWNTVGVWCVYEKVIMIIILKQFQRQPVWKAQVQYIYRLTKN